MTIGGLVFFFFMAGQKCHISKIPFSELEAKRPSATFRKSIFFHPFNPFYSAFLIKIKLLFDPNFFQTHTKSGKHENNSLKTLPRPNNANEKNGQKWQNLPLFSES